MSNHIEQQIQRLTNQLAAKKAQLVIKQNAERNRNRVRERKLREQRIYKLGGMVEKMGLDALPDETLLGMLWLMNTNVAKPSWCRKFMEFGKPYLVHGKKLKRPELPSAERMAASVEKTQGGDENSSASNAVHSPVTIEATSQTEAAQHDGGGAA